MISDPTVPVATNRAPSGKCILVVEDEFLIRFALSDGLRDAGFFVIEACSGDEAAELLGTIQLDLIISDVRMPGSLDGMGLLAEVRQKLPSVPVILVSGHLQPALAMAHGAAQFFAKPYALEEMLQAIDRELGK